MPPNVGSIPETQIPPVEPASDAVTPGRSPEDLAVPPMLKPSDGVSINGPGTEANADLVAAAGASVAESFKAAVQESPGIAPGQEIIVPPSVADVAKTEPAPLAPVAEIMPPPAAPSVAPEAVEAAKTIVSEVPPSILPPPAV